MVQVSKFVNFSNIWVYTEIAKNNCSNSFLYERYCISNNILIWIFQGRSVKVIANDSTNLLELAVN